MLDKSIISIRFWATPKGELPHYLYMFRNMELLRPYIKNVVCSRLGSMLYLEIQKLNEAMTICELQQQIKGTVACIERLKRCTRGCGTLMSKYT